MDKETKQSIYNILNEFPSRKVNKITGIDKKIKKQEYKNLKSENKRSNKRYRHSNISDTKQELQKNNESDK
ncbi:TPA_asm: hypothetical protein [Altiarchaeum virus]|nr:MAG: hypothetical protein BWK75_06315 [Candidatus Altiarchaeales archaeon A3]DAZ85560.1 TPA_asm: hypothetical protein [Altiarchaeum virus]